MTPRKEIDEIDRLMEEGAVAFRAGAPPTACPYQGHAGEDWLDGWLTEEHKSKKAARGGT